MGQQPLQMQDQKLSANLHLTAFDSVGQAAGIAGVAARSGFGVPLLLGLMTMWVAVPLATTMALFHRREL